MEIKSILFDERIDAANVLVVLTIREYLSVAPHIIDENEYQRKKVIKSKIKEILREDLLKGCSIPPIVLSIKTEELGADFNYKEFRDVKVIEKSFVNKSLLIIDGLQRTYVMLGLHEELNKKIRLEESNKQLRLDELIPVMEESEGAATILEKFLNHRIRAEIYVGLNRLGILYRMITLNTGQTTMSTRHLMEILYFDYKLNGIDGIEFVTDKEEEIVRPNTYQFKFKDALDAFNSYLEKDEYLIERTEILDNIKTLNTLSDEEYKQDLFQFFIVTQKNLLDKIIEASNDWRFDIEDFRVQEFSLKAMPFGKSVVEIFKKSQAMTGFGAAIGYLKARKNLNLDQVNDLINNITTAEGDFQEALKLTLKHLDSIKEKSKKIGNDQRFFFRYLFQELFDPTSDNRLQFDKAIEIAFDKVRAEKLNN